MKRAVVIVGRKRERERSDHALPASLPASYTFSIYLDFVGVAFSFSSLHLHNTSPESATCLASVNTAPQTYTH